MSTLLPLFEPSKAILWQQLIVVLQQRFPEGVTYRLGDEYTDSKLQVKFKTWTLTLDFY